jgi:hypothetical protein
MVICFDSTAEAKKALDALIETGQFQDVSEVISMALVNYHVIHRSVSTGGQFVVGSPTQSSIEHVASVRKESIRTLAQSNKSQITPASNAAAPAVPELFKLKNASIDGLKLLPMPNCSEAGLTNIPPAKWLFGQYNKFLPVKATCRALLNLLQQHSGGVPLSEALETIPDAAWELGDFLYTLDKRENHSREDLLAAAFPTTAGTGAVSRIRFANQFIGDLRQPKLTEGQPKEVKFTGFPTALKFIVCSEGKQTLLGLTTAGADFAVIPSPVLDNNQDSTTRKFSDAETEFLLTHITHFVPEETSAYLSIIDAISEGSNTPDDVDKYLCQKFHIQIAAKAQTENEITQTFLTTQRTGAISRMVDLGLVAREKTGLRVTYTITHTGKNFWRQIQ